RHAGPLLVEIPLDPHQRPVVHDLALGLIRVNELQPVSRAFDKGQTMPGLHLPAVLHFLRRIPAPPRDIDADSLGRCSLLGGGGVLYNELFHPRQLYPLRSPNSPRARCAPLTKNPTAPAEESQAISPQILRQNPLL